MGEAVVKVINDDDMAAQKKAAGARIEAARRSLALNQSELSRLVGVSAQAVQQWEKGETTPRGKHLAKISECLQTSAQYLQFGDLSSQKNTGTGPADLTAFMQSKTFEKLYRDSVTELIGVGCDLSWLSCKSQSNIHALSDIGLMKMRQNKSIKK